MMLAARIFLSLPAITGFLLALVAVYTFFGMTRPNSKGPITAPEWAMAIGFGVIVLLLHLGYIMAPFAIGTSWHRTAFWWIIPTAVIASIVLLSNLRWYLVCLSQGKEAPGDALFRGAWGLSFGFVWYVVPALVMWVTRPAPAPPITASDAGGPSTHAVGLGAG